jgi:hypothetical protein
MAVVVCHGSCIGFRPLLKKDEGGRVGSMNLLASSESEQRSDGYLTYTFVVFSRGELHRY